MRLFLLLSWGGSLFGLIAKTREGEERGQAIWHASPRRLACLFDFAPLLLSSSSVSWQKMMHKGGGGGERKGDGEEGGYIFPQVAKIFIQGFHKLSFFQGIECLISILQSPHCRIPHPEGRTRHHMSKRKRKGNPHGGSGILYIQTMNADKGLGIRIGRLSVGRERE